MKNVGEYLKNSRTEKKIEISTIVEALNISRDVVSNIENDNFATHLDKVYLTGHVRAYAKYLNLNENEIVKQFKAQTTFVEKNLVENLPKPLEKDNLFFASKGIAFFSMILVISGFYFFFIRSNDLQHEYSLIPDLPENLQSEVEEVEMELALEKINKKKSKDSFEVSESSVIASLPTADEISNEKTKITLKFLNSTWIQLRNQNDEIVFSKLMNKNNEYAYSTLDNYVLTVGNAGNIVVVINGESRGKAGKSGEVIESLIISSDFNN